MYSACFDIYSKCELYFPVCAILKLLHTATLETLSLCALTDSDSVQSDVDDRCESDISGVADDDLSSSSLGDLPITAGDVKRSYKHKPNTNLNSVLTTLALVFLFGAVGIGVGHFLGTYVTSCLLSTFRKRSMTQ